MNLTAAREAQAQKRLVTALVGGLRLTGTIEALDVKLSFGSPDGSILIADEGGIVQWADAIAVNEFVLVEQANGITAEYEIDRRGDWHLISRSDA